MSWHGEALDVLRGADLRLAAEVGHRRSLAPGRETATSLVELGEQLLGPSTSAEVGRRFAGGLARVVVAQAESFPDNLFWDSEFVAARLLAAAGGPSFGDTVDLLVALQHAFGRRSRIQFRYVHDFSYGFDWARWVRRDPAARGSIGPYGTPFLEYTRRRAAEIEELVLQDDAKYPALPRGASRNPFGFGREPAEEERLHRDLAERGLVPVEAWRIDATPRWDLPFSELREERARALGIWKSGGARPASE